MRDWPYSLAATLVKLVMNNLASMGRAEVAQVSSGYHDKLHDKLHDDAHAFIYACGLNTKAAYRLWRN